MRTLLILIAVFGLIASYDAASLGKREQTFTLRGRVLFPTGLRTPIETDGKLTVELQDTSLADAPARVIGTSVGKAIRFPMAFAIKYSTKDIIPGGRYSLSATIRNANDELLYINDVHIEVTPIGASRTKLIDVPVILTKQTPKESKTQWPELVGKNGEEAVRIIKQETGFTNVKTHYENSPMTMDYRSDRVRVVVNKKGIVTMVPSIA